MPTHDIIMEHLDTWSSAIRRKSSSGRGSSGKLELYGFKKLRELILDLAVRGLLVPQNPNDEPACELLNRIVEDRNKLLKEGKLKKQNPLFKIEENEVPFEIPAYWELVRIGSFCTVLGGKRVPRGYKLLESPTKHAYIRVTDMKKGTVLTSNLKYIDGSIHNLISQYVINKEDVYITIAGTIGSCGAIPDELDGMNLTENAARLVFNEINKKFLVISICSGYLQEQFDTAVNQMAQPKLSLRSIKNSAIAIPPLEEQKRIVAKVEELMALCDQLEAEQESSIEAHEILVTTLLDSLTSSIDREGFEVAWNRVSEHFDTLFTTESSVDQLKQTILQLAVMGKLVSQDREDEPASELLMRIEAEKRKLVNEGKIKKQKALPDIEEGEVPFQMPEGWVLVRFSIASNEISTGPFGTMISKDEYIVDGTPLINPSHMINGLIVEDTNVSVGKEKADSLSSYTIYTGDIVMARRGELGRCAIVSERENKWLCGTGSFVLRFHPDISREFIVLFFRSEHVVKYLGGKSVGATMTNLNHGILKNLPITLPPVSEQKRIVAKVNELMAICDQLKSAIKEEKDLEKVFADAVVSAV